jgi:hypothetical protein
MQDIFLGVDQEDLLLLGDCPSTESFFMEKREDDVWRRSISLRSNVLPHSLKEHPLDRSIVHQGETFSLPLRPWTLPKLIPTGKRREVGRQWLEAKTRSLSSVIMGGGREERSYSDLVILRFGSDVYKLLYAPYVKKRFGIRGEELSAGLARVLHFQEEASQNYLYETPLEEEAPMRNHWGVSFDSFCIEDGCITGVIIEDREISVTGNLFVALPVNEILRLLPNTPKSLDVDAQYVQYRDVYWMELSGDCSFVQNRTHFLDADHPCIVADRMSNDSMFISFDGDRREDMDAWVGTQDGLSIVQEGIRKSWVPIWNAQAHFRYRRIACYLEEMGIHLVGKRALFSHKSMFSVHQLRTKYADVALSEFLRLHIEPPVRQDDINASITEWIVE